VRARIADLGPERRGLGVLWGLGVVGLLLGLKTPSAAPSAGALLQAVDIARILTTTALVAVLVLGPGLALRAAGRQIRLGFLPLPGLAILVLGGSAAWAAGVAGWVHPHIVSLLEFGPLLALMPLAFARRAPRQILSAEEWRALLLVGGALGIAIGRALWSLDLPGELYAGTIYRTLEVGDRPDSRISYHVVELVANGNSPWGAAATSYFSPYNFSSRGPLAGVASAVVVLLAGGKPPAVVGTPAWSPFDPQGFMAYRLAMMTFGCTCFLSLWTLVARLGGRRAAHFAVLLAVTTPFLVHEVWFTWPKLAAASLVLLAAVSIIDRRRAQAGALIGVAYLVHPLALLSVPALVLLALWPLVQPRLRRPRMLDALYLLGGLALFAVGWRLFNGSHYSQSGFLSYLTEAGPNWTPNALSVTLGAWIDDRLVSVANTLIPLRLFFFSSADQEVNSALQACFPLCSGGSPPIEHFFFQYWNTVPFGLGIVFFPMLLVSVWRAARKWPWAVTVAVIVPFVAFAVYWGSASTGLLREGLHAWVLTLLAVVALEQRSAGFPWLRSRLLRGLLVLRAVEVLIVAVLPTIWTLNEDVSTQWWLTDNVALAVMVGVCAWLGVQIWRWAPHRQAA